MFGSSPSIQDGPLGSRRLSSYQRASSALHTAAHASSRRGAKRRMRVVIASRASGDGRLPSRRRPGCFMSPSASRRELSIWAHERASVRTSLPSPYPGASRIGSRHLRLKQRSARSHYEACDRNYHRRVHVLGSSGRFPKELGDLHCLLGICLFGRGQLVVGSVAPRPDLVAPVDGRVRADQPGIVADLRLRVSVGRELFERVGTGRQVDRQGIHEWRVSPGRAAVDGSGVVLTEQDGG